jgi:TRAP-type C4-dicarboxylate transport system permease small subunit
MFYEVVMRYVFVKPTLWVNEMSLWTAGPIYLLAGLYVMQQRAHIRIFILYDVVSRNWQRAFDVLSTLLICLFSAAVVWGGYNEAYAKLMRWETFGTAWDPPIPATMKPLVLLTVTLIAIQAVMNLVADWHKEKQTHDLAEEVAEEFVD